MNMNLKDNPTWWLTVRSWKSLAICLAFCLIFHVIIDILLQGEQLSDLFQPVRVKVVRDMTI